MVGEANLSRTGSSVEMMGFAALYPSYENDRRVVRHHARLIDFRRAAHALQNDRGKPSAGALVAVSSAAVAYPKTTGEFACCPRERAVLCMR